MARIRKGKFLGQEIELDELQASTEAAEATAETIASGAGSADAKSSATAQGARTDENTDIDAAQHEIEEVLREASRSPRIGFVIDVFTATVHGRVLLVGLFPYTPLRSHRRATFA